MRIPSVFGQALSMAISAFVLSSSVFSSTAAAYPLQDEAGKTNKQVQANQFFKMGQSLSRATVDTDPAKLAAVARETLAYLNAHPEDRAATGGLFNELGISLTEVKKTLALVQHSIEEDLSNKRPARILDTQWLNQNFHLISWQADLQGAQANKVNMAGNQLRITKYVVFEGQGQTQASNSYCCALYSLPNDEAQLETEAAEAKKSELVRYRYTKQQVIAGALTKHGVKPLVWLTRQGLEDALMQGSIMVKMPDGKQRMFNVHRNNGIGYDRKLKDPKQQRRYWYFKEVKGILGYGQDDKILVQPEVTFAGDVYNLGLGKIVAIRYLKQGKPTIRLGVLADTGGAFVPNLYQLDYLAGVFPNRAAYQKGVAELPSFAETFILIAK